MKRTTATVERMARTLGIRRIERQPDICGMDDITASALRLPLRGRLIRRPHDGKPHVYFTGAGEFNGWRFLVAACFGSAGVTARVWIRGCADGCGRFDLVGWRVAE